MIRLIMPEELRSTGNAVVSGKFTGDPANKAYPYKLTADRVEFAGK